MKTSYGIKENEKEKRISLKMKKKKLVYDIMRQGTSKHDIEFIFC